MRFATKWLKSNDFFCVLYNKSTFNVLPWHWVALPCFLEVCLSLYQTTSGPLKALNGPSHLYRLVSPFNPHVLHGRSHYLCGPGCAGPTLDSGMPMSFILVFELGTQEYASFLYGLGLLLCPVGFKRPNNIYTISMHV